jgi:hypothetical protein
MWVLSIKAFVIFVKALVTRLVNGVLILTAEAQRAQRRKRESFTNDLGLLYLIFEIYVGCVSEA